MKDFVRTSGVWVADLAVATPSVSLQPANVGVQGKFTVTVSNVGTTSAEDIVVRFLLDGAPAGADRVIESLHSNESAVVTSDTWNSHQQGTHVVTVVVDPANAIADSNKLNNSNFTSVMVRP
jgi:uncharacterized repeat protein (TIGR01451 family)